MVKYNVMYPYKEGTRFDFEYYRERYQFKPDDFPNARFVSERTISLPLSTKLTDEDVQDVIDAVKKVLGRYSR